MLTAQEVTLTFWNLLLVFAYQELVCPAFSDSALSPD